MRQREPATICRLQLRLDAPQSADALWFVLRICDASSARIALFSSRRSSFAGLMPRTRWPASWRRRNPARFVCVLNLTPYAIVYGLESGDRFLITGYQRITISPWV